MDINHVDYEGYSALYIAAENGRLEVFKLLVTRGAKKDFKRDGVYSIFYTAARHGHQPVCDWLLYCNADVNEVSGNETALMAAAYKGHESVCKLLLLKGANIHFVNFEGQNALCRAIEGGMLSICELLVRQGCHVNHKMRNQKSLLNIAVEKEHHHIAKFLLNNNANVNYQYKDLVSSPLYYCAKHGHAKMVELLINYEPNLE